MYSVISIQWSVTVRSFPPFPKIGHYSLVKRNTILQYFNLAILVAVSIFLKSISLEDMKQMHYLTSLPPADRPSIF